MPPQRQPREPHGVDRHAQMGEEMARKKSLFWGIIALNNGLENHVMHREA